MKQIEKQSGASLMLAVLILSAVTAIAFSLAVIVFIEIRSSGDTTRTEPALYSTFGVTEEALFQYKRFYTPDPEDEGIFNVALCRPKGGDTCSINGVNLDLPGDQPLAFDNSPRVEFIAAGETKTIPLYTNGSPDGDDWDKVYETVAIEPFPNELSASIESSLKVTNEDGSTSIIVPAVPTYPGSSRVFNQFNSRGQYELVLRNPNQTQDVLVKIDSSRVGNAKPGGLPFVGELVFRILADYAGLSRTYQVKIPLNGGNVTNTKNYAAATQGAVASASSTYNGNFPIASAINGDRTGAGWGSGTGGWNDTGTLPSWFQVNFSGTKSITEIDVYTLANAYPTVPDASTLADADGILDFQMQYWNGSSWITVPGGNITGNTLAWRKANFPAVSTDRIRINITAHRNSFGRIVEVEAY